MMARILWLVVGFVSLACGLAGTVLPLLPTTPFLLLAAFSFSRSSRRVHDWLVTHPRIGPPIRDWRTHGAVSRRAKGLAVLTMVASLVLSLVLKLDGRIVLVQSAVLLTAAVFVLSRPTAIPKASRSPD